MATFRVAVHLVRTGLDGERQESTEWFRVRAMGRLAEFAQPLTKGARVLVVGRLEVARFQSRDGEPRVGFDVWADEVVSLAGRPVGPEAEPAAEGAADEPPDGGAALAAVQGERPAGANGARAGAGRPAPAVEDLDELPF